MVTETPAVMVTTPILKTDTTVGTTTTGLLLTGTTTITGTDIKTKTVHRMATAPNDPRITGTETTARTTTGKTARNGNTTATETVRKDSTTAIAETPTGAKEMNGSTTGRALTGPMGRGRTIVQTARNNNPTTTIGKTDLGEAIMKEARKDRVSENRLRKVMKILLTTTDMTGQEGRAYKPEETTGTRGETTGTKVETTDIKVETTDTKVETTDTTEETTGIREDTARYGERRTITRTRNTA